LAFPTALPTVKVSVGLDGDCPVMLDEGDPALSGTGFVLVRYLLGATLKRFDSINMDRNLSLRCVLLPAISREVAESSRDN
jgi:hypothetical protein